jgi:hypothetical protein
VIKRVHLVELRTALTQVFTAAGRPAPTFAEPTITARSTPIRASHLSELRTLVRSAE